MGISQCCRELKVEAPGRLRLESHFPKDVVTHLARSGPAKSIDMKLLTVDVRITSN